MYGQKVIQVMYNRMPLQADHEHSAETFREEVKQIW
jgi:hypothetical protein